VRKVRALEWIKLWHSGSFVGGRENICGRFVGSEQRNYQGSVVSGSRSSWNSVGFVFC
jgi:hypothetical protein